MREAATISFLGLFPTGHLMLAELIRTPDTSFPNCAKAMVISIAATALLAASSSRFDSPTPPLFKGLASLATVLSGISAVIVAYHALEDFSSPFATGLSLLASVITIRSASAQFFGDRQIAK